MKTYNPAADSTIETPGKKRKRSEQNGDSTPAPSVPDTPVTPATEEGLCTTIKQSRPPELQSFLSAARIALAGSRISRKRSSLTSSYICFTCPRLPRKPEVYDFRLPASGQPELLIHGAGQKDRGNSQDGNDNK